MTTSGFYFYYCDIIAQPNDEDQYEDFNEFDMHVSLVVNELAEKEPKRQPTMETQIFNPDWVEISLKFRVSYRDGTEDIYRFIDLVKETLTGQLNVIIIDFSVSNIT
ncbi:MAG: hypothetical protein ACTSVO_13880 [Candidatus Heimdallarchaeaceae archaeon]